MRPGHLPLTSETKVKMIKCRNVVQHVTTDGFYSHSD